MSVETAIIALLRISRVLCDERKVALFLKRNEIVSAAYDSAFIKRAPTVSVNQIESVVVLLSGSYSSCFSGYTGSLSDFPAAPINSALTAPAMSASIDLWNVSPPYANATMSSRSRRKYCVSYVKISL